MRSYYKKIFFFLFVQFISISFQQKTFCTEIQNDESKKIENEQLIEIIKNVETGISSDDIDSFSKYFAKQIELNLREQIYGFFSNNQAYYILKNFFYTHRFINFSFTKISLNENTPYATGGGFSIVKGKKEIYQVYISFAFQENKWVINQFNVY